MFLAVLLLEIRGRRRYNDFARRCKSIWNSCKKNICRSLIFQQRQNIHLRQRNIWISPFQLEKVKKRSGPQSQPGSLFYLVMSFNDARLCLALPLGKAVAVAHEDLVGGLDVGSGIVDRLTGL
jgi:hypothetical protein